jgi:hypothetical protein
VWLLLLSCVYTLQVVQVMLGEKPAEHVERIDTDMAMTAPSELKNLATCAAAAD